MKNKKKLIIIFTFFVCVLPILHQYASFIPNITLGETFFILMALLAIYDYLNKKIKINIRSPYLIFIIVITIASLLSSLTQNSFDYQASFLLFARLYFYFFIVVIMGKVYFDFKLGLKIYNNIAKICSVYLIIQTLAYYLLNKILPSIITFIPLYNNEGYYLTNFEQLYSVLYRPHSIFLEPGTFAQYVLPCLALNLFGSKFGGYKVSLKMAVFYSISLILSLSAQAFIITAIIWVIWIIFELRKIKGYKKIFLIISMCVSFVTMIILVFNIEFLYKGIIGRFVGDGGYDSTGVRVIRGFQVFNKLDILYKGIGVGFGNITRFVIENDIRTPNDLYSMGPNGRVYNYEYMNGIAYILVSAGIIGIVFYIVFLIKLFLKTQQFSRMALVILSIYSFVAGVIISPTWVIIMIFIYKEYDTMKRGKSSIIEFQPIGNT